MIQMQPEEVREVSSQIRTEGANLLEAMQRMSARISAVANQSWQGQSAQTFSGAYEQWKSAFTQMHAALESMPPALDGLVMNMEGADRSLNIS